MPSELSAEAEVLLRRAEEAVHESSVRLEPVLLQLSRVATVGSEPWAFAVRLLAERSVQRDDWRASLLARRVVRRRPDDHRAWAILALAQSLLGNHRFAIVAYRRALALAPTNPFYAHNLGHLLDVVVDQPERALPWLEAAQAALPDNDEVTASLAHALLRSGAVVRAREAMRPVAGRSRYAHHHELYRAILDRHDDELATRLAQGAFASPVRRRVLVSRRSGRPRG